jgi:hypothetical protein
MADNKITGSSGMFICYNKMWCSLYSEFQAFLWALLSPYVLTITAFRFMHAQQPATLGTCPSFLFVFDETSDAQILDSIQILYHAHAVPGSISFVQTVQSGARKAITFKTVFDSATQYLIAVLNMTRNTGF